MVDDQVFVTAALNSIACEFLAWVVIEYVFGYAPGSRGWSMFGLLGVWLFVVLAVSFPYQDVFPFLIWDQVLCGVDEFFRFIGPWIVLRIVWLPLHYVVCLIANRGFHVPKSRLDAYFLSPFGLVVGAVGLVLALVNTGAWNEFILWLQRLKDRYDGDRYNRPSSARSASALTCCVWAAPQQPPDERIPKQWRGGRSIYCPVCRSVPCRCRYDCDAAATAAAAAANPSNAAVVAFSRPSPRQQAPYGLRWPSTLQLAPSGQRWPPLSMLPDVLQRKTKPPGCRRPPYECEFCGRDCKTFIGLWNHQRACGPR